MFFLKKARNRYRDLSEKEKEAKKECSKSRYKQMKKKNANLLLTYKNE